MRAPLSVETLLDRQFCLIGCWKLDVSASLVLAGTAPSVPGVYAFAVNGIAQYVGVASVSLAKRLYFYRKPGPSQKTNIRLNASLRKVLERGCAIDIYTATPPNLQWNGWNVSGPEGLEASIIMSYALPWNVRGASPFVDATVSEHVEPNEAVTLANKVAVDTAMPPKGPLAPKQFLSRPVVSGSKYLPLCNFLSSFSQDQDKVSMTFGQIEQLVGPLPKSATLHRAWWANHEGNTQSKGWMPSRFLAEPDPAHRVVVFRRFSY